MHITTSKHQTSNPVSTKGWPNKKNLKGNSFKIDYHLRLLSQEMHLEACVTSQILNTCGVQV